MIDPLTCLMLVIGVLAIGAVTVSAVLDVRKGAKPGATLKRWGKRVLDVFFSTP